MAKTEAPKPANTWYDVVAATQTTLPWREEQGVQVLGAIFATAPSAAAADASVPLPNALPTPTPTPLGPAPETPEQTYGRAVHQLLQGVPLPPHTPYFAHATAEAMQVRAALPWLWNAGSRAEVAMVLANGTIGRADRLVPHEGAWWVIDFKTGEPQQSVPANYAAQLRGYAQALQASYPDAVIKTAIVWVSTATLAETLWNG